VRLRPDGSEDRLADYMQREGGARGYWGGFRDGWCWGENVNWLERCCLKTGRYDGAERRDYLRW